MTLSPLSVYVHIPWCVRKCPYCDFNSHAAGNELPEQAYLAALKRDLLAEQPFAQGRKVATVFFGGGTPSLFSAQAIGEIITLLDQTLGLQADAEITLEANPGTFERQKFRDYLAAGVTRLSVGVQSFNGQHLQKLGRIHSGDEAHRAIVTAMEVGYQHINIDLMHGLPEQSAADAMADLHTATQFGVDHISWYQLTIEPNTVFYSKPPTLPVEDTLADIQEQGADWLALQGYQQYEVSAFAQAGGQCHHNLNYWRFGDYLGIGAGAHGKVTDAGSGLIQRRRKTRLPEHYLQAVSPLAGAVPVAEQEQLLEFAMNALRLVCGVESQLAAQRLGQALPWPRLQPVIDAGLLQPQGERFVTTDFGFQFLNETLARIDDCFE
ncbi:radical SAM family heme chaperone HemW [Halioxenophilus aromaticivorans]|uniref:radical SAM family heme chaperone HemW n=1 Tax=Halioxenophilus aromaticivorans TaxID=1306992 RepID=UPI0036F3184F